jgi:glycosyltransferase involved in cell wall biosynthesis
MRYLWALYHHYHHELPTFGKFIFTLTAHYVRAWDFAAAQRVTAFVANSQNVANGIRQYYARDSTVLYPPINLAGARLETPGDSYLAVGRLVSYKRFDLVIAACNRLKRKLRIVGSGPEERTLRAQAAPWIEFLGQLPEEKLWEEYARCRALLFAAEEDFGLTPIEAQACGRPVIAYGRGGARESIVAASTGSFFAEQSETAISRAILDFEQKEDTFDPAFIQSWASRFEPSRFRHGLRALVDSTMAADGRMRA